ncbi:MFS transporter [Kutzneria buriramensis]|uniref:Sugar phosphate permease n=1 Tax=Kutzneria buriramensis TaxID=1045776 RepID=A0A3E0IB65_9PSEU|nr:MFS transporter [Kutzneria buriramensis]REH55910.1 sugar phosphate permease [Kutzneria buriramensis]
MTRSIDQVQSSSVRKVALASAAGTTIELYDFLIYGTASAVALGKLFFPAGNPTVSILLAYATFGVGFLVRPLGAAVIGHFGDRVGRRPMLVLTLTATGVCTALIGVLPTYAGAGLIAPVLLLVLRLLQGFFLGGEQSGAALMVVEHAPERHRTWYGGWTFLGSPLGLFLGTAMFSLSTAVSGPAFLSWGWRIPFLASLVLVAVGIYMRLSIEESPEFKELRAEHRVTRLPLGEVLRTSWRKVVLGVGVNLGFNAFIFVLVTFVLSYWTSVHHLPQQQVLNAGLVGAACQVAAILVACRIADRVGRTPVMLVGAVFIIVFAFPLFWLVDSGSYGALILAMALAYAGSGILFGPMAAYYATLFEPRLRYSGAAFSYQLGATLGGGLSPLVATALLGVDHARPWPVSLYLVLGGLISALCLLGLRRLAPGPAAG